MPKKLTQLQAKLNDPIDGPWLIGQYKNCMTKTEYKCKCGSIFMVRPDTIWNKSTTRCKNCANKELSKKRWKGTKDISGHYFCIIKNNAKKRNLDFNITLEQLQELLEKQQYKCALSGLDIVCSRTSSKKRFNYKEQTASLDRIDSSKGYIIGNIQWLHKDINNMKQSFSEKQLFKYCKLILKIYENKKS